MITETNIERGEREREKRGKGREGRRKMRGKEIGKDINRDREIGPGDLHEREGSLRDGEWRIHILLVMP
jgi:hypothetical protein